MVLGEDHKIVARPASGGRNQAIKAQKPKRITDALCLAVVAFAFLLHIDAQRFKVGARQALCLGRRDP